MKDFVEISRMPMATRLPIPIPSALCSRDLRPLPPPPPLRVMKEQNLLKTIEIWQVAV